MHVRHWAVVMSLAALAIPRAHAQQSATLNRFSASASPADDFQVDRASVPGHLRFGAILHLDYGLDPLVYSGAEGGGPKQEATIVGHELMANATFSLGIGERLLVFAGLPAVLWMDGDETPTIGSATLARHDDAGLGDAYLGGRLLLLGGGGGPVGLAAQVTTTFPTAGPDQRFRGDDFLSLLPEVLVTLRPGMGSRLSANLGARIRRESSDATSNLAFGNEFSYAIGFAIPVWRGTESAHFDLHAQAFGTTTFADVEGTPIEALAGVKYFHQSGFVIGAAGGPGITKGFGSPVVRTVLTVGYHMPAASDRDKDGLLDHSDGCPDEPEDMDGFEDGDGCPDWDNDQDNILDASDRCPNEAETDNELDDTDGCPDAWGDRDGDTLLDNVDTCPDEPEDADGFEDTDGCPDPDNDQDGVLDVDDKCPMEKGVPAEHGCPIPDRDGDGVADAVDNCPDEPGKPEFHGCNIEQKVVIEETGLQLLDKVYFETGKAVIRQRSFALLDNVASALNSHPDLRRVIVEGHTDSRGRRAFNIKLSQARAESVVAYLVTRGVQARRLEAKGYGPDKPRIEGAKRKADHAKNRRVEFSLPVAEPGIKLRPMAPADQD